MEIILVRRPRSLLWYLLCLFLLLHTGVALFLLFAGPCDDDAFTRSPSTHQPSLTGYSGPYSLGGVCCGSVCFASRVEVSCLLVALPWWLDAVQRFTDSFAARTQNANAGDARPTTCSRRLLFPGQTDGASHQP